LKMLKGKQIELVILIGQFPFVGIILGDACFTFCKQVHQVYGVDIWYFVHLIVSIKHSTSGDTTLLGRLAKAGCFGFVGNICDAFGKKCVLSGN
jgi:hypothetical protein